MTRGPSSEAILSARIQRAYPSLSPYSAASLAKDLCAIERAQRRHAERCCSGEDGGYTKRATRGPNQGIGALLAVVHDPEAEERAGRRIAGQVEDWLERLRELAEDAGRQAAVVVLEGDPRGSVLRVQFPSGSEPVGV